MRKISALLVLMFTLSACSLFATKRDAGYDVSADDATEYAGGDERFAEVLGEAELAWTGRADIDSLRASVELYNEALALAPRDQRLPVVEQAARATYLLADGYMSGDPAAQKKMYHEAIALGERCMSLDPEFRQAVRDGARPDDAAGDLGRDYAGCMYWTAAALGKWAAMEGFATRVANRDRIVALVERVTELDREYFFGGPDRYWGAYFAIIPGFMGRDLDKSEEHFRRSLEIAPNFLGTKVLMAEQLATARRDREMYTSLLTEVLAADPAIDPEIEAENRIEQAKARRLLDQVDDKVLD